MVSSDLVLVPAIGKKDGRSPTFACSCEPTAREAVADACFTETATIGLRWQAARRAVLPRARCGGQRGAREGGDTACEVPSRKAESDDLARIAGLDARRAAKRNGGGAMTELEAILARSAGPRDRGQRRGGQR